MRLAQAAREAIQQRAPGSKRDRAMRLGMIRERHPTDEFHDKAIAVDIAIVHVVVIAHDGFVTQLPQGTGLALEHQPRFFVLGQFREDHLYRDRIPGAKFNAAIDLAHATGLEHLLDLVIVVDQGADAHLDTGRGGGSGMYRRCLGLWQRGQVSGLCNVGALSRRYGRNPRGLTLAVGLWRRVSRWGRERCDTRGLVVLRILLRALWIGWALCALFPRRRIVGTR